MKKILLVLVLIFGINCTGQKNLNFRLDCPPKDICNIEVSRVYDADTIFVNVPTFPPLFSHELGIRIRGIDTPEIKTKNKCEKKLALKARDWLRARIALADNIYLKDCEKGKYFRLVCDVFVDLIRISDLLVHKGYAVPYDGGTKTKVWCEDEKK